MRVRTTFRARRSLRTMVLTGLMSAYFNDANARLSTSLNTTALEGITRVGVATPGNPIVAGWSGSNIQETVTRW